MGDALTSGDYLLRYEDMEVWEPFLEYMFCSLFKKDSWLGSMLDIRKGYI